jgi:alkanesulfonate monooxygenase SsuD/methylene tetrahydromethanopterin reductase-like flavin-dependent oxidoreductase (luciferase family)
MNVGLYFDLRDPPAWRQGWSRTYGFALEMCEEAEHLGAHSIWLSEHHLFEDGYLPQPLTFAAAVAARTNLVRIGTAIVVAPFRHPVHLAEEAAIVDAISGGRLDLGLGAGYRAPEFALFGADPATSRYRQTEALVRDLRRIWAEGAVTPPPLQSPLPVWLGYNGPSGHVAPGAWARDCSRPIRPWRPRTGKAWPRPAIRLPQPAWRATCRRT